MLGQIAQRAPVILSCGNVGLPAGTHSFMLQSSSTIETRESWIVASVALHLLDSLSYLNLLHFNSLLDELTQYKFYPPLIDWVVLPFYKVFGTSIAAAVATQAEGIADGCGIQRRGARLGDGVSLARSPEAMPPSLLPASG